MKVNTYQNATDFLKRTQSTLEANEACNSLILGVCQRLAAQSEEYKPTPCLKTVEDGDTLVIAAMMTPPHNLVLNGHQCNIETAAQILADDVHAEGWDVPGTFGPGDTPLCFAERWGKITHQRYELQNKLRVYALQQVIHQTTQSGELRKAISEDKALAVNWWYAVGTELHGKVDRAQVGEKAKTAISNGDLFVWDDGQPVSMAMKTRPTTKGIGVTAVYTPPEFRGKGYATACVGTLSQLLLDEGWEYCALFADLANPISNHVYTKIGYKPVCDYSEYIFKQ
jgi:predicted GNAT family acetyltransferase